MSAEPLVVNLAHTLARAGQRTVVVDFDPQCDLSVLMSSEERLFQLWKLEPTHPDAQSATTIMGCLELVGMEGGHLRTPELIEVADDLWLLPGHLGLNRFETRLAELWPLRNGSSEGRDIDQHRLNVACAPAQLLELAARQVDADIVLVDVGPSLGALNRAVSLGCDAVLIPLAPDLFSLQALENVGPTLQKWRQDWGSIVDTIPSRGFQPIGYVVQYELAQVAQFPADSIPWEAQIPASFHHFILNEEGPIDMAISEDEWCIASFKNIASLIPLARSARKPLLDLKQADGAGGSHLKVIARYRREIEKLVERLLQRMDNLPT